MVDMLVNSHFLAHYIKTGRECCRRLGEAAPPHLPEILNEWEKRQGILGYVPVPNSQIKTYEQAVNACAIAETGRPYYQRGYQRGARKLMGYAATIALMQAGVFVLTEVERHLPSIVRTVTIWLALGVFSILLVQAKRRSIARRKLYLL